MEGNICKSVYCHWDGYLEHNGAILQAHYDSAKAAALVALGDISSLAPSIDRPEGHSFDKSVDGYTVFYARDRNETGCEFATDATFEDFFNRVDGCFGEWYYIMKDGVWYVGNTYERDPVFYKRLVSLSEAMLSLLKDSVEEAA
jgi:hypothetical protein